MPDSPQPRVPHCLDLKDDTQAVKRCKQIWNEGIEALRFIPEWLLSESGLEDLRNDGHGVAPDLIYAKGDPNIPSPSPGTDFDKQLCSLLILIELGFCADLSCQIKREEKANKYAPLMAKLKKEWGAVYLVCIPVGCAGNLLSHTAIDLATALSAYISQGTPAITRQDHHNLATKANPP